MRIDLCLFNRQQIFDICVKNAFDKNMKLSGKRNQRDISIMWLAAHIGRLIE